MSTDTTLQIAVGIFSFMVLDAMIDWVRAKTGGKTVSKVEWIANGIGILCGSIILADQIIDKVHRG